MSKQTSLLAVALILSVSMMAIVGEYQEFNKCSVRFIINGEEIDNISILKNRELTYYPEIPEIPGYTSKWIVPNAIITEDSTIEAQYTRFAYVATVNNPWPESFNIMFQNGSDPADLIESDQQLTKDKNFEDYAADGQGQITFKITCNDIATVEKLHINGAYGSLQTHLSNPELPENYYRITKVSGDLTIGFIPEIETNFSKVSGFYESEFDLEIHSPGEIHYTLDGSTPTKSSPVYEHPISITSREDEDNVYSARTDTSAGFNAGQYVVPTDPVDKCAIIRTATFYKDLVSYHSATYFIGYDQKEIYDDIGVISLITDPANLFDYETGIMVTGKKYDEYIDATGGSASWWWNDANYRQKGIDWERAVDIAIFNESKDLLLEQEAGLRIHGGGSRGLLPRSFNLYARWDYGDNRFGSDLFGNGFDAQRLTLFSGGDDYRTKILDKMMSDYTQDYNISNMHYRLFALFIDGEYWGNYWLTEKYDEEYLEYYYHLPNDDVILIKNGQVEVGNDEDIQEFESFLDLSSLDYSIESNYEKFCNEVDINSFVDYYAIQIYIARWNDWSLFGNTALWKTREPGIGDFADGKWRMMLFDVNSGALTLNVSEMNSVEYTVNSNPIVSALMKNNHFRESLKSRILDVSETFSPDKTEEYIENWYSMKQIYLHERDRFPIVDFNAEEYFDNDLYKLNQFFKIRYNFVDVLISTIDEYA